MLKCEEILATLPRPTGDVTTEARSYKLFFDQTRAKTLSYFDDRFQIIWRIGVRVGGSLQEVVTIEENSSSSKFEAKNIDPIAHEFCRINKLLASLNIIYNRIIIDFKNLLNVQVDYFVDPDSSNQEGVIFRLVIKDKPKKILQQENNFYSHIRNSVPVDERKYFSIVYSVI